MILVFLCLLLCSGVNTFFYSEIFICFFCNDTATTETYTYGHTLSLHDALPILQRSAREEPAQPAGKYSRRRTFAGRRAGPGQIARRRGWSSVQSRRWSAGWISDAMEARWPSGTHGPIRQRQAVADGPAQTFRA